MFSWRRGAGKLCVQIPIPGFKGGLFVSPMPWGPYDTRGGLIKQYRKKRIDRAVLLVTDEELQKKARRDLLKIYEKRGIEVTRFPIADLTKPVYKDVTALVTELRGRIRHGERLVIHCNAGVGRTGTIAACVVCSAFDMNGDNAIEYIQLHMHVDLVDEQVRFVKAWGAQYGRPDVMGTTPVVELIRDEDLGPVKHRAHQ